MSGITVIDTDGTRYALAKGDHIDDLVVAPTSDLALSVYGPTPETGEPQWLGSFGDVQAVYANDECVVTADGAVEEPPKNKPFGL